MKSEYFGVRRLKISVLDKKSPVQFISKISAFPNENYCDGRCAHKHIRNFKHHKPINLKHICSINAIATKSKMKAERKECRKRYQYEKLYLIIITNMINADLSSRCVNVRKVYCIEEKRNKLIPSKNTHDFLICYGCVVEIFQNEIVWKKWHVHQQESTCVTQSKDSVEIPVNFLMIMKNIYPRIRY